MTSIFLTIFNLSISAGWVVLVVIGLRFLLHRLPKAWICLLWVMVAIRLCLPFSIESVLSLMPSAQTIPPTEVAKQAPQIHTGFDSINMAIEPILQAEPIQSATPLQTWLGIASVVWLIGVAGMGIYALVSILVLKHRLREAIPMDDGVFLCDRIRTPFLFGWIRPRIYLPSYIQDEEKPHILAHEQAHIMRKDHWWKPLGFLLLAVYWFHPLMWCGYILLCRDIEMACDEHVAKHLDAQGRRAYSDVLLSYSVPKRMITACPIAFGEMSVKARIRSVLHYKKPTIWIMIIGTLVIGVSAVLFLTDPEATSSGNVPVTEVSWNDFRSFTQPSKDQEAQSKPNIEFVQVDAALDAAITRACKMWGTREHVKGTVFEHHGVVAVMKDGATTTVYTIGATAEYFSMANDLNGYSSKHEFYGFTFDGAYNLIDTWIPIEGPNHKLAIQEVLGSHPNAQAAVNYANYKDEYATILLGQAKEHYGVTGLTEDGLATLDGASLFENAGGWSNGDYDKDGTMEKFVFYYLHISKKYLICEQEDTGEYKIVLQDLNPIGGIS